jgi:hypothetical protein
VIEVEIKAHNLPEVRDLMESYGYSLEKIRGEDHIAIPNWRHDEKSGPERRE